jgi:hypothetical protein
MKLKYGKEEVQLALPQKKHKQLPRKNQGNVWRKYCFCL